jgi:hypothetical protein
MIAKRWENDSQPLGDVPRIIYSWPWDCPGSFVPISPKGYGSHFLNLTLGVGTSTWRTKIFFQCGVPNGTGLSIFKILAFQYP